MKIDRVWTNKWQTRSIKKTSVNGHPNRHDSVIYDRDTGISWIPERPKCFPAGDEARVSLRKYVVDERDTQLAASIKRERGKQGIPRSYREDSRPQGGLALLPPTLLALDSA